jgi:hypothetical protein
LASSDACCCCCCCMTSSFVSVACRAVQQYNGAVQCSAAVQ